MKHLISICLISIVSCVCGIAIAQTDQAYEKLKTRMWGDPEFKINEVPDKWKNESAVILAKSYGYEVKKEVFMNYVYEDIYLHKRVKLLDKPAITEFSEFSFANDYKNSSFWASYELKDVSIGIKVIKPSGKENIVDLKSAVLKEIKEGFNKKEYKKIAIPDLEIGDIIDYFYVVKNTYVEQYMKILDPVYYLLVEEYPIVKQKFNVQVLRQMYFNSKSINGAPELKQTDKDEETSYSFVDGNREKADASLWAYSFRIYPTLKFQAFFIKNKTLNMLPFLEFFLKEKKSNSSSVDLNNMDELTRRIYMTPALFDLYLISETNKYLSKNCPKNSPSDTLVKYAYYYMRQKTSDYGISSLMLNMTRVLEKYKIKHDLVITIPNSLSDISDLILPKEVDYLIRIKGKPDYFIGDFSPISTLKSINSEYQGNNAYAVSFLNTDNKVEKIIIPVDNADANLQSTTLNIKFADNSMDSLSVNANKVMRGIGRDNDISFVVTEEQYLDEVSRVLNRSKKPKPAKKTSKQLKEEKEKQQKQEQHQKDNEEVLKNNYKSEFDAGDNFKINSYSLKTMGIWDNSPEFQYEVSFKLGNMVKKMGPNYLVPIGKLITKQMELSKKDMVRKIDVYEPYPRAYEYKIVFEIPAGYKVKGLEKLNVNVTNPTGGFTSKAELKKSTLVVDIRKYYNHNFEKASEWPKMVAFIEAAYNFTQQSILFEKAK